MYRSTGHTADPARHGDLINPDGIWRKAQQSSFEGNCVEICPGHVQVGIRNSRDPGPRLLVSYPGFRAFVALALEVGEDGRA